MKKEQISFIVVVAVVGALIAFGGGGSTPVGPRRGPTRKETQLTQVAPNPTPGRFLDADARTWDSDGRNIYSAPSEVKDLPALDLAPPPTLRLPQPGAVPPIHVGGAAQHVGRRAVTLDLMPGAAPAPEPPKAGDPKPQDAKPADPPKGTPPTTAAPIPTGTPLTPLQKAMMSVAEIAKREQAAVLANESQEKHQKRLDKLTFIDGIAIFGEYSVERKEDRYAVLRSIRDLRILPNVGETERDARLKKILVKFKEDRDGKLRGLNTYTAERVKDIELADTPVNRYHQKRDDVKADDVSGQVELVKLLTTEKLWSEAAAHLEELRKKGQSWPQLYDLLAEARIEMFQYDAALGVAREGLEKQPGDARLLARQGTVQLRLGLLDEAAASFEPALAKDPDSALANIGMGEVLIHLGRPERARGILKQALSSPSANTEQLKSTLRLLLTEAHLGVGDLTNAAGVIDIFFGGTSKAPDRAYLLSSVVLYAQRNLEKARQRLDEGVRLYPTSGAITYMLAVVLIEQDQASVAQLRLDNVAEFDPFLTGHVETLQALLSERAGDDDKAASVAEHGATVASPGVPDLRGIYGRALLYVNDPAKAREQLLLALDADPTNVDILVSLGDAAVKAGEVGDALRLYDRAATIEPDFPDLVARRVIALVRRRKLKEADDLVAKSAAAHQTEPMMLAATAFFQYTKGNQKESLNILKKLRDMTGLAGNLTSYATDTFTAISDNENKSQWTDPFTRTGATLGRAWQHKSGAGIVVALQQQAVQFSGTQRGESDVPTLLWQERPGERVQSFSSDLDLQPQPGVYAGIGIMTFTTSAKGVERWPGWQEREAGQMPFAGIQMALAPDGNLMYRVLQKAVMGAWKQVPGCTWHGGQVNLEIRQPDPLLGRFELAVNKETLVTDIQIDDLKRFRKMFELQIFCQATLERAVQFTADNVMITTWKEGR